MGNQQTKRKNSTVPSTVDDLLTGKKQQLSQTELTSKPTTHSAIDIKQQEQIKGSHNIRGKSPRNTSSPHNKPTLHQVDSTSSIQDQSSFSTTLTHNTSSPALKESCTDEISMDDNSSSTTDLSQDEEQEIERSSMFHRCSMDNEDWFHSVCGASYADHSSPPSAPTGLTPPISFQAPASLVGKRARVVQSSRPSVESLTTTPSLRSLHSQSFNDQSIIAVKDLINVNIVV